MARRKSRTWVLVIALGLGTVLWWIDHRDGLAVPRTDSAQEVGGYRQLDGCRLVEHRLNDGDSFHVREPGGNTRELRLYFVDAPESVVKHYGGGESNEERLGHQARYFDNLSPEETTALGQDAKKFANALLAAGPFTVFTRDELVFGGPRVFAFVQVERDGQQRWLHELLVEQGLARIYTQGARLPEGTSTGKQERNLRNLERQAKAARRGGWK